MGVRRRTPWSLGEIVLSMQSVQKQVVDSLLAQISVGIPSAKIIDLTASKITAGTITANDIRVEGTAEGGTDAIVIGSSGLSAHIKSDNFVTRTSGFRIRSNGNAEFNDVLIRGDLESGNWDGSSPANLTSFDSGATAGFYLDSSVGAAQFSGDLFIGGRLELTTGTESIIISGTDWGTNAADIEFDVGSGGANQLIRATQTDGGLRLAAGGTTPGAVKVFQNRIDFEIDSADRWKMDANVLRASSGTGALRVNNGSAGAPTLSFVFDTNTGFYRAVADEIRIATGGARRADFSNSGLIMRLSGSAGTPAIRLNDVNTGFFLQASDQIGFAGNGTKMFHMSLAGNGSRLYGNETNDFMEIDGVNEWFQFFNLDTEILRMVGTGSDSVLELRDRLTDIGNHEILRLNRGTGTTLQRVGYSSSWIIDPETGFRKKVKLSHLRADKSEHWQREWYMDLDPIQYERRWQKEKPKISRKATKEERAEHYKDKSPDPNHLEINFYIENLIEHTNLLTTKGSQIGNQPDTEAILAVTVDFVQNLHKRLDEALERIAVLEAA